MRSTDIRDVLTEDFVTDMFAGSLDSGASLEKKGPSYVLRFEEPNGFYFGFTADNPDTVRCFSDIEGLSKEISGNEFIENLDVISALLLQLRDGIDRGVADVDS